MIRGSAAGIDRLRKLLAALDLEAVLAAEAAKLSETIQRSLSHRPGSSDHSTPWLRSGNLRQSISSASEDDAVVVGSTDPVAIDQELGTRQIPPRPFLAPAAAAEAPELVASLRSAVSRAAEDIR